MADYIEVNTDILESDISTLASEIIQSRNCLKMLYDHVQQLNTTWKGQANEKFNVQFRNDYENMNGILNELEKYKDSLQDARQKYEKCEDSVYNIVRSIRI